MNLTTRLPVTLATTRLPSRLVRAFDVIAGSLISLITLQPRGAQQNDPDAVDRFDGSAARERRHLGRRLGACRRKCVPRTSTAPLVSPYTHTHNRSSI
jgi:hypothetical protein